MLATVACLILGLFPLVIGLTVVSLDVLLVLGAAALVLPIAVRSQLLRTDIPVLVALSALLLVLSLDGTVGRSDGVLFVVLLAVYVTWSVVRGRRPTAPDEGNDTNAGGTRPTTRSRPGGIRWPTCSS